MAHCPTVRLQQFCKKRNKKHNKKTTSVAHFPTGAPLLVTTSNGALCLDAPLVCLDRRTSSKKIDTNGAPWARCAISSFNPNGAPLVWCAISVNPIYSPFSSSDYFISEDFAFMHGIKYEEMNTPLVVHTPAGQCQTSMVSHNVTIEMEGLKFHSSPIILKPSHINLILGMDQFKTHIASIVCSTKTVHLLHPLNEIVSYHARLVQNAEARLYSLNAFNALPLEGIEHIPVICDFQDVFPEELLGIPLIRVVKFVIHLKPGTTPIAKQPYKTPPHELLELKEEIDNSLCQAFIGPSSSTQGACSLFVKNKDGTNRLVQDY